jgi:hypothetical protein
MTADHCACARRLHALLAAALPHVHDGKLREASDVALTMSPNDPRERNSTLLAIQIAVIAIENSASAADGQKLLLEATKAAEQRVQAARSNAKERRT